MDEVEEVEDLVEVGEDLVVEVAGEEAVEVLIKARQKELQN